MEMQTVKCLSSYHRQEAFRTLIHSQDYYRKRQTSAGLSPVPLSAVCMMRNGWEFTFYLYPAHPLGATSSPLLHGIDPPLQLMLLVQLDWRNGISYDLPWSITADDQMDVEEASAESLTYSYLYTYASRRQADHYNHAVASR